MIDADFHYAEYAPPPQLASYVRCIWQLRAPAGVMVGAEPVLPDGRVEMVLNLGDPFIRHDGREAQRQSAALIAGQLTRAVTIQPTGRVDLWGVRFHAWSAAAFFGVSGAELRDRFFDVDELGGHIAETMASIVGRSTDREAYDVLSSALVARLARSRAVAESARFLVSAATKVGHGARVAHEASVRALAARAGVSTRRVQTIFRDDVGLAPKQLLRITRLQRALQIRRTHPSLTWGAVAARAGFFDHAHLVRDVHAIAGRTPSSLVVDEGGLTDTFLSDAT